MHIETSHYLSVDFTKIEASLTDWLPTTDEELSNEQMMEHEVCLWLMTTHDSIIETQIKCKGQLLFRNLLISPNQMIILMFGHPVRGKGKQKFFLFFLKY